MCMGNNVILLVSSVQRVERVSHKTQSFHLINFIKRTKPNKDKAVGLSVYWIGRMANIFDQRIRISISSAINDNSSSATWRRVIASLICSRARRNTLFISAGRTLSTRLRMAAPFAAITLGSIMKEMYDEPISPTVVCYGYDWNRNVHPTNMYRLPWIYINY